MRLSRVNEQHITIEIKSYPARGAGQKKHVSEYKCLTIYASKFKEVLSLVQSAIKEKVK